MRQHAVACLFVTIAAAVSATAQQHGNGSAAQAFFVLTRNHYTAEGFSPEGRTTKFGELILIGIWAPSAGADETSAGRAADKYWVNNYYRRGMQYQVFQAGEAVGSATVLDSRPLQCNSHAAVVSANVKYPLAAAGFAVATNAPRRSHRSYRRQATAAERLRVLALVRAEFRARGVSKSALPSAHVDALMATATRANGGHAVLVGRFSLRTPDAMHRLFAVVATTGRTAKVELANYHPVTDLEDFKDEAAESFVDQFDFDGDGNDELVTETRGYESEYFSVYRLVQGKWQLVHKGGEGGC